MKRLLRIGLQVSAFLTALLVVALGTYDVMTLRPIVRRLRGHLQELSAEHAEATPAMSHAIDCADPYWEQRLIDYEASETGASQKPASRLARMAVWRVLMPMHFSRQERLSLYAYFMPMGAGQGLAFGAREYFGKTAPDLSYEEAYGIMAIAQQPSMNSPRRSAQRYQASVDRLIQRCGKL